MSEDGKINYQYINYTLKSAVLHMNFKLFDTNKSNISKCSYTIYLLAQRRHVIWFDFESNCVFSGGGFLPQTSEELALDSLSFISASTASACKWRCSQSRPKKHQKGQRRQLIFHIQAERERKRRQRAEKQSRESSWGGFSSCRAAEDPLSFVTNLPEINIQTLSADASLQVGGLWEAIWLRAWRQQIPCWSNRWTSASWELCPQISVMVLL